MVSRAPPSILSIQSSVVSGYVGNKVASFTLQVRFLSGCSFRSRFPAGTQRCLSIDSMLIQRWIDIESTLVDLDLLCVFSGHNRYYFSSSVIILIPMRMELSGVACEKFCKMLLINTADPDWIPLHFIWAFAVCQSTRNEKGQWIIYDCLFPFSSWSVRNSILF